MNESKICRRCGEEKPTAEFYIVTGYPHLTRSECISCMLDRSRLSYGKVKTRASYYPAENEVLAALKAEGVYADLGKNVANKQADIVAWGCVNIEVKSSVLRPRGYQFKFTQSQIFKPRVSHVVVLVCINDARLSFHVFDANDPVFFIRGKLKAGLAYIPDATHRKHRRDVEVLMPDHMARQENCWNIIEDMRLSIALALIKSI